ncbi:MAG: glycosyltransferase [Paludibacteraceae bacterium]|nr:glycosyltransferase [Paludibacteraceae bacterium]
MAAKGTLTIGGNQVYDVCDTLLSFLVPVYNVEAFVGECLQSLFDCGLEQSQFEVIVLLDGSKDGSEAVVRQRKESNLKIYSQANKGLALTRNELLKLSSGKYVWFVDSDDKIEPRSVATFLSVMEDGDLDVLMFDYKDWDGQQTEPVCQTSYNLSEIETGKDFYLKNKRFQVAWSSLYKRSFLLQNGIVFPDYRVGEDLQFSQMVYFFSQRVRQISLCGYYYRQVLGSLSKTSSSGVKSLDAFLKTFRFASDLYPEKDSEFASTVIFRTLRELNVQARTATKEQLADCDYWNKLTEHINYARRKNSGMALSYKMLLCVWAVLPKSFFYVQVALNKLKNLKF